MPHFALARGMLHRRLSECKARIRGARVQATLLHSEGIIRPTPLFSQYVRRKNFANGVKLKRI